MAFTIAISGKGGSGKTTIAAMLIRYLKAQSKKAILAVDADPNSCLGMAMGIEPAGTIADLREDVVKGSAGGGVARGQAFEYGMHQQITEAEGFDLLTMGQPEGPRCYCAANNMLRKLLDELSESYGYVIIDNEAGMEHLSRRTTNNVDLLIIVAEPTNVGRVTAKRIIELSDKLPIAVKKTGLIWNRATEAPALDDMKVLGFIPDDETVLEAAIQGKTVFELEENCPALAALKRILEKNNIS